MPSVAMKHEKDPKERLLEAVGDISEYEVADNQVLFAIYLRPEKTLGGILMTQRNLEEDLYQSKVGLVLAMGEQTEGSIMVSPGDWIVIRPADAWAMDVNQAPCRMIHTKFIKGRIPNPDMIW